MFIILRLEIIFDTLKRLIVDKIPTQFNLPGKKCFYFLSCLIMTSQNWKKIVEKIRKTS